ncbi:MAG: radical SAM protein [Oligoflexia bacterium]|nr:radical SAM protein [Oligoflexia bacterium]
MKEIKSIYIHFPYCKSFCNYCDFFKIPLPKVISNLNNSNLNNNDKSLFSEFHQYLDNSFMKVETTPIKTIETLYIGGGSPSLWGKEGICYIKNFLLKNKIQFTNEYEFTLEFSPATNNWESTLNYWREIGVNRISVGVQTLNSDIFYKLERKHTIKDAFNLLDYLQKNNWNYSVDFMLGLPGSEKKIKAREENGNGDRDIVQELKTVMEFKPNHFSIYIFSPQKTYPNHLRKIIPTEDFICEEYLKTADYLKKNAFVHYEVSNFAKFGFESRHNQRYWNNCESYLALGPSSSGFIIDTDNTGNRYTFSDDFSGNIEIDSLGEKELLLEKIYLTLRTNRGLNALTTMPIANKEEFACLAKIFISWKEKGLVESEFPLIKLSSKGLLLLDSIMDDLFKCLQLL